MISNTVVDRVCKTISLNVPLDVAEELERRANAMQLPTEDYFNIILKQWVGSGKNDSCKKSKLGLYKIRERDDHLRVVLEDDFCHGTVKTIIHHVTSMPKYAEMNDLWLIGKHQALVSLGDIAPIVTDFKCLCPSNTTRQKTAVVVAPGHTEFVVRLWVTGVNKHLPFEARVFHELGEAEEWLGVAAHASSLH
jgi:hypothetical protein